ncbi:MAG: glycine betaine ABC transporter substrate-binding protein [Acidimicrobiales bacterium]
MRRPSNLFALMLTLGLVASGCGDSGNDASETDFDGIAVVVGSKNFTEQYVLSEILIQGLAARGADVTDNTDTGDTAETRAALLGGDIDAYWEYNSTGWVEHLGRSEQPDSDGEALTKAVAEADRSENQIEWIGRSSFNDTYGFVASPAIADETAATRFSVDAFDLEAMAEYLDDNDDTIVCVEPEFPDRGDGLVLFTNETGFAVPDDRLRVFDDAGDIYGAVADGTCDFGEVFTTDGRIDAFGLTTVVDPGVFYVYNVSLNIPTDVYNEAPDSFDDLVGDILAPMSKTRITELNRRVSDGESVAEVAADYLDTFGINP